MRYIVRVSMFIHSSARLRSSSFLRRVGSGMTNLFRQVIEYVVKMGSKQRSEYTKTDLTK